MDAKLYNKAQARCTVKKEKIIAKSKPTNAMKVNDKTSAKKQKSLNDSITHEIFDATGRTKITTSNRNVEIKKTKPHVMKHKLDNMIAFKPKKYLENAGDTAQYLIIKDYNDAQDTRKNNSLFDAGLLDKAKLGKVEPKPNRDDSKSSPITATSSGTRQSIQITHKERTTFGTYIDRTLNNLSETIKLEAKMKIFAIIKEANSKMRILETATLFDNIPELKITIYEYVK